MNELKATNKNQTPIEIALGIDAEGRTTAKKLYEFLELDATHYNRWIKSNILDNRFAEEGVDYEVLAIDGENPLGGRPSQDYKLTASFAKKLSMTAKSEKGEEAREYFVSVEEGAKDIVSTLQELSPQLQLLINVELEQKKQAQELLNIKEQTQKTADRVESIREVVALNPNDWRKDSSALIIKIAQQLGDNEYIKVVRDEIYRLLEQRMGVSLKIRLTNKRKTMALNGVCKSKIDKLNQLDVIADDKKLIEGYLAIVKEMAVKYGISLDNKIS